MNELLCFELIDISGVNWELLETRDDDELTSRLDILETFIWFCCWVGLIVAGLIAWLMLFDEDEDEEEDADIEEDVDVVKDAL